MNISRKINPFFNVALYIYLITCYSLLYLITPVDETKVPWDRLYESFPKISITIGLILPLMLTLIGAKLMKYFWNDFVMDLFKLRSINLQEAWSIVLLLIAFA